MSDLRIKNCPDCEKYFDRVDQKNLMRGFVQPINGHFRVLCTRDACDRMTAIYPTQDDAINAWNTDCIEI